MKTGVGGENGGPEEARPSAVRRHARRFREAYAEHRAAEGRGTGGDAELLALPYLKNDSLAKQWAVRSRSFKRFVRVLRARAREVAPRPLEVLDLGAGNGWLCYRVNRAGHRSVAVDVRCDAVDGLAAAAGYERYLPEMFGRIASSFDALPLPADAFDVAVFNASIHYAQDLGAVLREAARVVRPGGRVVVLDSPFYARAAYGELMVAEKRREAMRRFGALAHKLTALSFVEYLTRERLAGASIGVALRWRRHRVRYPLWYEARPLVARIRRRRPPSRFDVWEATVPERSPSGRTPA